MSALHEHFHYTGYWLNNPPQEHANTWAGKRELLKQHGFGFLVLFNGRVDAQIIDAQRKGQAASALGKADGDAAIRSARKERFPKDVLIFLDQEEGGRLLPEQSAYVWAWVKAVRDAGARAGVYCSGIDVPDGKTTISTARDLLAQEKTHQPISLWIANDQCPPSPGCTLSHLPLSSSGFKEAMVWQYAQSPRRAQFSAGCPKNNDADGNCYAPGLARGPQSFVDLNTAGSSDPSGGR